METTFDILADDIKLILSTGFQKMFTNLKKVWYNGNNKESEVMKKNVESPGEIVKKTRKDKNISARKLAELCDFSHTEINNIENGS